ncbi:MAG TPA: hypothetical protein VLG44_08345 [Chlamydiales bacterium]|nr:hypothetical protein [Chlamydiales bacterium]
MDVQEKSDLSTLQKLLEINQDKQVSLWDKVDFYKQVITLLLTGKSLPESFLKNLTSIDGHPLFFFYKGIIHSLLHLPYPVSSEELLKLVTSLPPSRRIFCEIGIAATALGKLKHNEELVQFAKEIALKEIALSDLPLLTKSQEYSHEKELLARCNLLDFLGIESYEKELPTFYLELKKRIGPFNIQKENSSFYMSDGIASFKESFRHIAISNQGMNTAIGSLEYKQIQIAAFGPQFFPLSDADGFGIFHQGDTTKDFVQQKGNGESLITLWSRLFDDGKPSPTWIGVQGNLTKEGLDLTLLLRGVQPKKIAFSFFIKAGSCRAVDQKEIRPQSLDRYIGDARNIICSSNDTSISFETPEKSPVHIIPLAGKGFFWDSDFLIAFELNSPLKKISLKLTV